VKRIFGALLILALGLPLAAPSALPFLLWLDSPKGRTNAHDPKSPLFAPPATAVVATRTITPTFTISPTPTLSKTTSATFSPTISPSFTPSPTFSASPTPAPGKDWFLSTPSAAFNQKYLHSGLTMTAKMWVIGGFDSGSYLDSSDVWSSPDGAAWTNTAASPFPARESHTSVELAGKMYVIAGTNTDTGSYIYLNDVWSSPDGATWTQETPSAFPSARAFHSTVSYNNLMYTIGGFDGTFFTPEVWSSSNGSAWSLVTNSPAFGGTVYQTTVAYNGAMWMLGGVDDTTLNYNNNVWTSTNGSAWTQVAPAGPVFSARAYHSSFVYNNLMWVVGGWDGVSMLNDVWSSSDGATWTQVSPATAFSARIGHTSAVLNNRMWVIAGFDNVNLLNDVWHSP
jgi:hypothetical protein